MTVMAPIEEKKQIHLRFVDIYEAKKFPLSLSMDFLFLVCIVL